VWAIGKRSGNGQSDQGGFGLLDAETRIKIFIMPVSQFYVMAQKEMLASPQNFLDKYLKFL
jgi:hypothetical protein